MIDSGTLLQGRFLIEDTIGMGGMGAVYRAVDQKFGSLVAIKETFYGDGADLTEAFDREARLLNGLHHPILPHVSDCFTENGGHFLVMEYIEGEDLSAMLKRGEILPIDTVVSWALDLLDGLDYLHSQDPPIIHRDIKPNNLKLTSRGRIVLLDFGMAKETSSNTLAAKSVFGYSRRYSPLEQIEGSGTDTRSDIFSLGATLYHLMTGNPPKDVLVRASAIVAGRPDPLIPANTINPDVPESIATSLSTALSLNPENRFKSAREMAQAFEAESTASPVVPISEPAYVASAAPVAMADVPARSEPRERVAVIKEDDVDLDLAAKELGKGAPAFSAQGEFRSRVSRAMPRSISSMQIRRPARRGSAVVLVICLLALGLSYAAYLGLRSAGDEANAPHETEVRESQPAAPADTVASEVENDEPDAADLEKQVASAPSLDEESSPTIAVPNPLELRKGPIAARQKRSVETAESDSRTNKEPARPAADRSQKRTASTQRPRRVTTPVFEQPRVSSIEAIMTGLPSDQRQRWVDEDYLRLQEERRQRRLRRIREARRNGYPF